MSELAVIGGEEFLLGFQLAGISNAFVAEDGQKALEEVEKAMRMEGVGIIVIDQKTVALLPEHVQYRMNRSVKPVVVIISPTLGSSNLRESIIRAIGVDLMKE